VIVIDDTTLGPGLGGVRFKPYADMAHAVTECRRLAAAMTLKNVVAELPFGGAKSVIMADRRVRDRAALMRRFGEFVAAAGGDYLPGVDMGTSVTDLALMAESGATVSCATEDPSRWTATGVAAAIRAAVTHRGLDLATTRVLIQGAGHVGEVLARILAADGATVLIADVDGDRALALAHELDGEVVDPRAVIGTRCDVFAPCAVARVIDPATVGGLNCSIIAGAANDTLSNRSDAERLAARDITYVPDFVANAGGVVDIHGLRMGWDEHRMRREVLKIGDRTAHILATAQQRGQTPLVHAEQLAAGRLASARAGLNVRVA
jgi:leucine dehydrogenase